MLPDNFATQEKWSAHHLRRARGEKLRVAWGLLLDFTAYIDIVSSRHKQGFFFLLLFWRHFFIQAHKIRLKTGDVWEWRQQPQLVYTCTSPLKRRCAASTRSITLYLCASDTKNATKVTFKERKAAGGDGLNINVSHRLCPILTLAWSDVALLRGLTLLQL